MEQKEKFTIEEQIRHMKSLNIKFYYCDEKKAKDFLTYSNYYFKVKSFAKNYRKKDGKYINLDFAYLRKFSILDTAFRELILELSLLREHLLKVSICSSCSQNNDDNGYNIVRNYFYLNGIPSIIKIYDKNRNNFSVYSKALLDKYRNNIPLWVLIEILNFGELISFYTFYKKCYNIEIISDFNLKAIKSLRNIAAHNSCILHTLTIYPVRSMKTSTTLKQFLKDKKLLSRNENEIKIPLIHDFLCLILVFSKLCPDTKMKKILIKKIRIFFKRCEEKSEYFKHETLIVKRYLFIKKATYTILRRNFKE